MVERPSATRRICAPSRARTRSRSCPTTTSIAPSRARRSTPAALGPLFCKRVGTVVALLPGEMAVQASAAQLRSCADSRCRCSSPTCTTPSARCCSRRPARSSSDARRRAVIVRTASRCSRRRCGDERARLRGRLRRGRRRLLHVRRRAWPSRRARCWSRRSSSSTTAWSTATTSPPARAGSPSAPPTQRLTFGARYSLVAGLARGVVNRQRASRRLRRAIAPRAGCRASSWRTASRCRRRRSTRGWRCCARRCRRRRRSCAT